MPEPHVFGYAAVLLIVLIPITFQNQLQYNFNIVTIHYIPMTYIMTLTHSKLLRTLHTSTNLATSRKEGISKCCQIK